jgi:hypothetical protein
MKAIQVKYLAATNTKSYRYKAFTKHHSLTKERPSNMEDIDFIKLLVDEFVVSVLCCTVPHHIALALLPCGDYVAIVA